MMILTTLMTGFAIGLIAIAEVVTRSGYYVRRSLSQPGNREWVITIETLRIRVGLACSIIFKGKFLIESWLDGLPGNWHFGVSPNRWTSDEIGLQWLQNLFIPTTIGHTKGKYQFLVLDGHGSNLTPKSCDICSQMIPSQSIRLHIQHIFYNHLISSFLRC